MWLLCLLYDSQVIEYNTPTIPKPCETSPQFFAMNKHSPMAGEHSRIDYSLRRSFRRSEEWQEIRIGFQSLGEISRILGTLVHTSLLDNVSIFKVGYLCTLPKNSFWVCTVQYCSTQDENQSADCDEWRLIEVAQAARAKPKHTSCPDQTKPGCPNYSGAPGCPYCFRVHPAAPIVGVHLAAPTIGEHTGCPDQLGYIRREVGLGMGLR